MALTDVLLDQLMVEVCPRGFRWRRYVQLAEVTVHYSRCGTKWVLALVKLQDDKAVVYYNIQSESEWPDPEFVEFELADPDLINKMRHSLYQKCWRWYAWSFVVEDLWLRPISWFLGKHA